MATLTITLAPGETRLTIDCGLRDSGRALETAGAILPGLRLAAVLDTPRGKTGPVGLRQAGPGSRSGTDPAGG